LTRGADCLTAIESPARLFAKKKWSSSGETDIERGARDKADAKFESERVTALVRCRVLLPSTRSIGRVRSCVRLLVRHGWPLAIMLCADRVRLQAHVRFTPKDGVIGWRSCG
jgi:hypothetical protein